MDYDLFGEEIEGSDARPRDWRMSNVGESG
jgi:hypothetical protein